MAKCIPGYEEASNVDQTEFVWIGKIKLGVVSRRINSHVRIIKLVEGKELVFTIESVDDDIGGEFSIVLVDNDESYSSTKIKLNANIQAQGSFQWLVD